jgi:hypothetical protein
VDSTAASSLPPSVVLQKTVQAEGLLDRAKEERDAAAVRALVAKVSKLTTTTTWQELKCVIKWTIP